MAASHDHAVVAEAVAGVLGNSVLSDAFLSVIGASDGSALDAEMQRFTPDAGFERYSVSVIHDDFSKKGSCTVLSGLHNTPSEFLPDWTDVEAGWEDPVMQQCKRSSVPVLYGQDNYVSAGCPEQWERQAPFGYACGITSVFHLPRNLHVAVGLDRRSPLPARQSDLADLVARVHLFGTFVQCAALSMLNTRPEIESKAASTIRLSRREHECLAWAAEGKTAWETGMLLSIAEGSVAKVLAAAIRKLGCVTKPQAVVKALRLGLIS